MRPLLWPSKSWLDAAGVSRRTEREISASKTNIDIAINGDPQAPIDISKVPLEKWCLKDIERERELTKALVGIDSEHLRK